MRRKELKGFSSY